jgi:hypothetical protein
MKTRTIKSFLLVCVANLLTTGAFAGDQKELDSYLNSIRESGMTEMAQSQLGTLASITTGHTLLSLHHMEGVPGTGLMFTSGYCPRPGTSPEEAKRVEEEIQKDMSGDLKIWKQVADVDSSGFVTTEEASKTRSIAEFGFEVGLVLKEGTSSQSDVAKTMNLPDSTFTKRLAKYRELAARALRFGLRAKALPNISFAEATAIKPKSEP